MQVTDLANATKTKSDSEVNKMFVDSASYILKATVGVNKSGKPKKVARVGSPLWDPKKLAVNDYFSCISYQQVSEIDGNKITVKNHHGSSWFISKDILVRDMWSADHFDKEV